MTSIAYTEDIVIIQIETENYFFLFPDLGKETIREYLEQEEEFEKQNIKGAGYFCFDFVGNEELWDCYLKAGKNSEDNYKWVSHIRDYIIAIRNNKNINNTETYKRAMKRAWEYVNR